MSEEINNTVAELSPQHNSSNNVNHSDTINSTEIPLNSTYDDKSSANLTMPNAGKNISASATIILLYAIRVYSPGLFFFPDSSQEAEENSFSLLQPNRTNMAKVTLRRAGYYTIPSLDKLDEFVRGETCIVPNFTIGREGYGNVYFPDSFDVYGLNLDEIGKFVKMYQLNYKLLLNIVTYYISLYLML